MSITETTELLKEPLIKWGAAVAISYYVIKELIKIINRFILKNEKETDKLEIKINDKIDKDDCKNFRTRIGKESDLHRKNIEEIKDDISDIKEGVAYIKGKMA